MSQWNSSHELVAIAVTSDGRRVTVAHGSLASTGKPTLIDRVRLVGVGLLGLLGLITGSRREPGGRRGERR